ncbi:hypothetical protein RHMOL_Rhmol08G0131400 [Rhododendron molle]|uniref:Uncharacterized protein n=1 Tax=Rhododendron molle TaxID=49168 RepID=A0ACC0MNZ6_RHOML|nr:hypothetical protein RHMOL_Rhmol08G0131400 [Rhododendron molle]
MSSPTISHVVSFDQSTMISHVIADDQPCRLFRSIHDDQPCHRRRSAMSSLSINPSTTISHMVRLILNGD